MTSAWMMRLLLCQYLALVVVCAFERAWWPMCYWVGASCITVAVLGGMR